MVSNPALTNNQGLIKTANIMLAVIQDLVSVQVIASLHSEVKLLACLLYLIVLARGWGTLTAFRKGKGT